ncbi:hypothetical protein ADEAN_000507000 [Angomonas deanei]|uniref:Uncharacterized protein n=1 Tax=Angomonas deanei TaxID=59799 RepID=A0A7G2CHA8_9TRYP|nr:hypothetical protein ADEAN_000507000 [Angomonas deanei]
MSDYDDDFEDDESVNNDPYRELGDEKKTENTKKKSVADDDKYRELGDEDKEESFSSYETSEDDEDILNLKKKPEPAAPASPPAANNNNKQDAFRELGDEKKEAPITTNNNDAYRELGEEKEKEEKKVVTAAAVSVGNKDTGKTHVQTAADFTDDSSSSSSESYEDPFDQERKSMLSHGVKSPEVPAKKNSTSIGSPTVVPSKNKPVTPISGGGANNENVHQSNVTTVEKLGEDEKTNFYNSTHEAVEEETRAPKKGVPLSLQGAVQNNNNNNKLKSDIRSASYSTKHSSDESEEEEEDSDSSSSSSASSSEKELSPKKQDPPPAADTRELSPKKEEPRITSSSLRKKAGGRRGARTADLSRGRRVPHPQEGAAHPGPTERH